MGMWQEEDLASTQCAAEWAQKFAFLLIFLELQEKEDGMESIISEMMQETRQS